MKRLIIEPDGWPCVYTEMRPGFFVYHEMLGLKTEYDLDGYCDTGEYFVKTSDVVQPVKATWEETEE